MDNFLDLIDELHRKRLLRLKIAIINISAISLEERKSDNGLRHSARAASQDLRRLHGFYTSEIGLRDHFSLYFWLLLHISTD